MTTGTELRLVWWRLARAWREWSETWPIAELFMPTISPQLVQRLVAVTLTAVAFSYAHYLHWLLSAGVDFETVPRRAALDGFILAFAALGGAWSCRQLLVVQSRSLLVVAVDIALAMAALVVVLRAVNAPADVASRWAVALAATLVVTVGMSLRLWAMLAFTIQGVRALREGRDAARAAGHSSAEHSAAEHSSAEHSGAARLLVRLETLGDGDVQVVMRQGREERGAIMARGLLPGVLRGSIAAGAWLLIEDASVEWGDEPRIVGGRVSYVGPDPNRPRPSWASGGMIVGAFAIAAYHGLAIGLAYGLTFFR